MNRFSSKLRLAALGLALTLPLHAAPPGPPPMDGPEAGSGFFSRHPGGPFFNAEHLPPYLIDLDLSESQRTQIKEAFKTQGATLREKLEASRKIDDELRRLALSADYTDDKAKALAESGAKIAAEAMALHAKLDQTAYQLLTPAQQQQLKEWMARSRPNCPGN